jgi:hypothetical protein
MVTGQCPVGAVLPPPGPLAYPFTIHSGVPQSISQPLTQSLPDVTPLID